MKLVEIYSLVPKYEKDIWDLLVLSDEEFVPPLSSRNSTQQVGFAEGGMVENKPYAYFETIKTQSFILALEEDKVIGFMSYIPNYSLPFLYNGKEVISDYVSTVVVHPNYRGRKITQKFYNKLFERKTAISTRTWSTNRAHIKILCRMLFEQIVTIENDRGEGIDTLYFLKTKD